MQDWPAGTAFAGMMIEAPLGRGGMSVVYRAHDSELGRPVAVKVIAPALSGDAEFQTRFRDEARAASAVDHPHIVPVYSFGEDAGWLYLAMRFIDGQDLNKVLRDGGPMTEDRALGILGQLADALDAIHRAGLVHRDVKPSNVMLTTASDGKDFVYLTDFGLARADQSAGLTRTGTFVGTIDYASPEQLRGEDATAASDQYAFAATAFECFAGQRPFDGTSDTAVMYGHAFEAPPSLSELRPGLSPAIDAVIRRGLAKEPGDRWPSCGAMVEALRLPAEPATATTDSEPSGKARRGLFIGLAAAFVVLALIAAALWSRRTADTATADRVTSTSAPPSPTATVRAATGGSGFAASPAPVKVSGPTAHVDGVDITRQLEVLEPARTELQTTVTFHNTTPHTVAVDHREIINKEVVGSAADVHFDTQGVKTVEDDPVFEWSTTIESGKDAVLQYRTEVNPDVDKQWVLDVITAQQDAEGKWITANRDKYHQTTTVRTV